MVDQQVYRTKGKRTATHGRREKKNKKEIINANKRKISKSKLW